MKPGSHLWTIYEKLDAFFGDLRWWPGDTPFEVIVGAILTQNTNWKNVERAIGNLREAGILHPGGLHVIAAEPLSELIRPSGYYRLKANRLKAFLEFLFQEYSGDLKRMFREDLWVLRDKLLAVKGIGEETADSILLYAGCKPVFVVDTYTRRILERHRLIGEGAGYGEIQALFMENLPSDVRLFNQFHALIVNTGKNYCGKSPNCEGCPLHGLEVKKRRKNYRIR
jgi:endonuclease-3 related protein